MTSAAAPRGQSLAPLLAHAVGASAIMGRHLSTPSRERGAAAVEMAIVLPILLFVVAAIIDFGRAFNAQIMLSNASREGVRMVALGYTQGDALARINQALACSPAKCPDYSVTYLPSTCPASPLPGDAISVTVTDTRFSWVILGDVSRLFGSAIPVPIIKGIGSMRCGG